MEAKKNKRALSITEAADYIGVSRGTLERWISEGLLPYEDLPGGGTGSHRFRRIRLSDIDIFLENNYKCNEHSSIQISKELKGIILLPKLT